MKVKYILLLLLAAIISGAGIAIARIASVQTSPAFASYGSWRGTSNLPLGKDNLVTTQVTLFALFALPSHEAIYLFATKDDKQAGLNGNAVYTITGNVHDIKAGYWSITAYGKDLYLIANEQNRYSFNNNNLVTDTAGNFKITVSAQRSEGNWLPVKKDEKFRLVLRIYAGENDFTAHLDQARLPTIQKATL